jgi:hypothetical protein
VGPRSRPSACCTVGKSHKFTNQRSQRLSYFKPPPVPKTLTTDTGRITRRARVLAVTGVRGFLRNAPIRKTKNLPAKSGGSGV